MEDTRRQFQIVAYFYNELFEAENPLEFSFYLSAFLSEARAVTWILDKEYKSDSQYGDDFVAWYGDTAEESFPEGTVVNQVQESELFGFMKEQRNESTKVRPQLPDAHTIEAMRYGVSEGTSTNRVEISPPQDMDEASSVSMNLHELSNDRIEEAYDIDAEDEEVKIFSDYYFDDAPSPFDEIPVKNICSYYFDRLFEILKDWELYVEGDLSFEEINRDFELEHPEVSV